MGRNITPLNFKSETVAETTLRASWFWATSARFPETRGIFSSFEDTKLIPDGLADDTGKLFEHALSSFLAEI